MPDIQRSPGNDQDAQHLETSESGCQAQLLPLGRRGLVLDHWLPGNLRRAGGVHAGPGSAQGTLPSFPFMSTKPLTLLFYPIGQNNPKPPPLRCQVPSPTSFAQWGMNVLCACRAPSRISSSHTASLSSPSWIHSRCFLVLSFSFFRGIVIGCALISVSLRILRLSSIPRNLQTPS